MNRVVITGATSSIGTALIEECLNNNIEILAIVNRNSKNIDRIPQSHLLTVYEASLDEYSSIFTDSIENKRYDAMFHLAWAATQGDASRALLQPQAMNIKYALDAVGLAKRLGCDVFVGSGSQAEYGRTTEVLTEEIECHPETPYGIAKLCAGQLTRIACRSYGIKHIWPRILSAYGPNCQPQTIVNYSIREMLLGNAPQLTACEQIWDFIYTGDVARALIGLAVDGHDGEIYVIGSGISKPLKDYILELRDIVNPSIEPAFGAKEYTENTVMHLACDISKLKRDIGFEPSITFAVGIEKTIDFMKS